MTQSQSTFIVAEAGVNHNGSLDMARQLVDVAVAAGADAVKFQTFKAAKLVSEKAQKADYQKVATGTDETQFQMLQRLELSHEHHLALHGYCRQQGIEFMSTAFDSDSLEFLVAELGLETLKIPSGEITNGPLLLAHSRYGRRLIVSTGMSDSAIIEAALGVIAFGFTRPDAEPGGRNDFAMAYTTEVGQAALQDKVTLLHCTTEYPAPVEDINLAAMDSMREHFALPIGYSDHSEGIAIALAAVARGASVIEKHFTLDKTLEGPDHKASLEPKQLAAMIASIRIIETAIGDGIKKPGASELKNIDVVRKSLVAAMDINKGVEFNKDNITIMRPGDGKSPMGYWDLLGKPAERAYCKGDLIYD